MPLILRAVKGSKLTIVEMDGNLIWLAGNISGSGVIPVTGSGINASNTPITSSFFVGDGSKLTNVTASFITASNVYGPYGSNSVISASYALSASRAVSSSYALTSSYASTINPIISGALDLSGSLSINGVLVIGGNSVTNISNIGGENTQIQFNSGSVFSGSSNFIYEYTINALKQGTTVVAKGQYSHAEGDTTEAFGYASHAEGSSSLASGSYSHAEGYQTLAKGVGSHAEGYLTSASADYSHASGYGTIATYSYQTVVGKFNNSSTPKLDAPFVVGYGTDNLNRRTIFAVTSNSSIYVPTQSAAPGWSGEEGEIVPGTKGGSYFIYVYIGGKWRSSSLS